MSDEPIRPDDIMEIMSNAPETKGKKVKFVSQNQVNSLELKDNVDKILKAIGVKWAFLTDLSSFGDFDSILVDDDLVEIGEELGVSVSWDDLICETALRMKK